MGIFIICFLLQVFLFVKVMNQSRSNLVILALGCGLILPPVIWFVVSTILDGYLEGMLEGLIYVLFSYLHILVMSVLLISKGIKIKDSKYSVMGVATILCLVVAFLFLINLFKGVSFKIGG
jgi:hypothetical protein